MLWFLPSVRPTLQSNDPINVQLTNRIVIARVDELRAQLTEAEAALNVTLVSRDRKRFPTKHYP
jgi:hypothetical protein